MIDEKKYRTEVPNIIDDLGLDPYERTLYVHYKRVCGANGGQCTEGVRGTAERTKMSFAKAGRVRQALLDRGLIAGDIQHGKDASVTIVDIWDINTAYFADKNRPRVDGWTVKQLREWIANCVPHTQLNEASSPPERGLPSNCVPETQNCVPHTQKKEPLKNEPIKNISPNGDSGLPPEEPISEKWNNANKKVVGDKFFELTHLKKPTNKKTVGVWWGWLFELFEMSNKDPAETCHIMTVVVKDMRAKHLTIASPKSLHGLARAVASGQELNGAQNGTSAKHVNSSPDHRREPTNRAGGVAEKITAALRAKSRTGGNPSGP